MKPGLFQILIILLIVLVLFGRGRISEMMGDFGKGIKSFKRGIADDETAPQPLIDGAEGQPAVVEASVDPRRAAD